MYFGHSVSLSRDGNTLAVVAPHLENGPGHMFVYSFDENEWKLRHSVYHEENNDRYGWPVLLSFDGKVLAVGSPDYHEDQSEFFGQVHVSFYNEPFWEQKETSFTVHLVMI